MMPMLSTLLLLLGLLQAAGLHAQALTPDQELQKRFPPQSIDTASRANSALAEVLPARATVQERAAQDESACYQRFLVSSCLAEVKERRRTALTVIRRIEVEAQALLRREKADERRRVVAERQAKAAAEGRRAIPISGSAREGRPENDEATAP